MRSRIGTEHEKVVFNVEDKTRADYSQIKKLLDFMVDRFGCGAEPTVASTCCVWPLLLCCHRGTDGRKGR